MTDTVVIAAIAAIAPITIAIAALTSAWRVQKQADEVRQLLDAAAAAWCVERERLNAEIRTREALIIELIEKVLNER